ERLGVHPATRMPVPVEGSILSRWIDESVIERRNLPVLNGRVRRFRIWRRHSGTHDACTQGDCEPSCEDSSTNATPACVHVCLVQLPPLPHVRAPNRRSHRNSITEA